MHTIFIFTSLVVVLMIWKYSVLLNSIPSYFISFCPVPSHLLFFSFHFSNCVYVTYDLYDAKWNNFIHSSTPSIFHFFFQFFSVVITVSFLVFTTLLCLSVSVCVCLSMCAVQVNSVWRLVLSCSQITVFAVLTNLTRYSLF